MSGALDPEIQKEVIDRDLYATAVLSGNRNFDGRIHPYAKQAFLASPPLVVAYAIAGTIRFDIEKDVLGKDKEGNPITLKDIWPSDEEIDAIVKESVKPEQFNKIYTPMFNLVKGAAAKSPLYDWRPQSTYIRRPPYWEGALAGERTMKGMRPLAVLGDNITTDHLSPSNAIMLNSAAGAYAIDGTETYDVIGEISPRADLTVVMHRSNGETVEIPVTCRLDTAEEVHVYAAGGVLQRFAQDFLESNAA
jgi:aconitate hydratase